MKKVVLTAFVLSVLGSLPASAVSNRNPCFAIEPVKQPVVHRCHPGH